jgi:large subunit ribosomal protein L10
MARTRGSKKEILATLENNVGRSKSIMFASLAGLKVKETDELRTACRSNESECLMAKKTLIQRVLDEKGYGDVQVKGLHGEVAAIFGYGDEITPAKVLSTFAKKHEPLQMLAGIILTAPEGSRAIDASGVKRLALLPSRLELLGSLVGTIANPMRGMVGVLQGNLRSLVFALNAIKESKA